MKMSIVLKSVLSQINNSLSLVGRIMIADFFKKRKRMMNYKCVETCHANVHNLLRLLITYSKP